jgi:3-hydroxybutyryl-CoA dehydrogenase
MGKGIVKADEKAPPEPGKRVAVVGAGLMGHGIAQVFAENGCSVALYDVADGLLKTAFNRIRSNLRLSVEAGLENEDYIGEVLSRIRTTRDLADAVTDVRFVTEAVPEDWNLKLDVFQHIDVATDDDTVLASNTSTLSLAGIAKSIKKGNNLIITHWFNPPYLIPVVEVVKSELTSEATFQRTFQFLKDIGKDPVHVLKQVPGFLVNRIQTAMFREVVALLEEGVASAEDIDKAVRGSFGLRLAIMGPLSVADFGGVDLWYKGAQNLYPALDASTEPRRLWTEMIEKGLFGAKTGRGFFEYKPQAMREIVKHRDMKLLKLLKILYPKKREGE